ncbi:unnamed protein product [Moneuplotes crassus]|uniref:Uncharacterized protein n=1 Tax=Euplotes crassus TaxID=5936 RepID=A0AAD1UDG7_EUPCR|nr:unnamed protein product [Moneuplotes crassus]
MILENSQYLVRGNSKGATFRLKQISNERDNQPGSIRRSCEHIPKELVVDLSFADTKFTKDKLPDFKKMKSKEGFKFAIKNYTSIPINFPEKRVKVQSVDYPSHFDPQKIKMKHKKETLNQYALKRKIHEKITKNLRARNSIRQTLRTESKKVAKIIEKSSQEKQEGRRVEDSERSPSMLNCITQSVSPSEFKLREPKRVDLTVQLPALPSPISGSPMFSPLGRKILKIEQKKISLKKDVMQKSILEFIQRGKQNSFNCKSLLQ